MNQILIQGIGYLALVFVLLSFQRKKRVQILLVMLIGIILFVVHYVLLGAWVGALMNFIEASVVFVAYKKETTGWAQYKGWPYVFIVAYLVAGTLTAKSPVDFLPVLAQIIGAIAVWQTSARAIRFIMLAPRPLWFIYNLAVGSYAGMTTEVIILASVVVGIVRFDILKKTNKHLKNK